MKAITYQTDAKITPPGWAPSSNLHSNQKRGFAYQDGSHYVHFYSRERPLWVLSPGLTATETSSSFPTINEWVQARFGATTIETTSLDVGEIFDGLWRPGLTNDDDVMGALGFTFPERRASELPLLLILERLNEILLYAEPHPANLNTFGYKQRELLLLAATEVEAQWKWFLERLNVRPSGQGFSTNDYVRLCPALFLEEFDITLPRYTALKAISPFLGWDSRQPTRSLAWYDAYNETKHDRAGGLKRATLEMCLAAVAANIVLFVNRFAYQSLYNGRGTFSAIFNETFSVDLARADPKSFYVPKISIPSNQRSNFVTFDSGNIHQSWKKIPITV